ncbi:MAG TPA: AAA family ATPase [Solirubrobacteraceae bacterium]|jgi:DNA polymerase-3 subunit delta'
MSVVGAAAERTRGAETGSLPGIDAHPHARAVLLPALPPHGEPSHAYLFHGPPGTGKRTIARAFAAALLADGAQDPEAVAERVLRGAHPDLTWVTPSGAAEMLVSDIEEPVVAAASRTPFESRRRVFVIEAVDTMNDQAANRMLKTLEEPPAFAHLLLLTDRREDVMATISSRCQQVRFDPLPPRLIAERLEGADGDRAQASARLASGDAATAALLASEQGAALRASAEAFVRSALAGATAERPWAGLLDAARRAGALAGEEAQERTAQELELLPRKEHRRHEREGTEARRRVERRVRRETLDLALRLAERWLRDLLCVREGAPELVYAVDRKAELEQDAGGRGGERLAEAVELVTETRLSLQLNVSEELALESLAYRLEALLAR